MIGFPVFIGGLLGLLLFHQGQSRALLIGLWSGYFAFGLVFNYRIYTHENYHLPLIPIVALSIAPIGILIINELNQKLVWQKAGLGIFLLGVFLAIININIIIYAKPYNTHLERLENEVRIAQEVGRHVGHSTKNIFLSCAYGKPPQCHGELAGRAWLHSADFRVYK